MNKRGTDKVISVYWFAILLIVAGAVVYMASLFYGEPYDVRELETNLLVDRVADCLSDGGHLKDGVWNGEKFLLNEDNFLAECRLNFNVEEMWMDEAQYYTEINFYEFNKDAEDGLGNRLLSFSEGNSNLKEYCTLQEKEKQKNLPFCIEREFYNLDKNGKQFAIKILSAVRKIEKNA